MGLYEEAVELSLEWGNLQLAQVNADAAGCSAGDQMSASGATVTV